jgi:peptidoglycan-associated lipoprotein
MKRIVIATLLISCLSLSACKTTNGVHEIKDDSGKIGNLKENSLEYFNSVVKNKIYFSTNKDDLTAEAVSTLLAQASWLNSNHKYKATIEGHCDERGTREFNLALGERRANMTKRELVKNGVDRKRLKTISYGKERPEVEGSSEEVWSMNRRVFTLLQDAE